MKEYVIFSIIAIASVMAVCLCVFCSGKSKAKQENEG